MKTEALINELKFTTARSAGSGGQHVNKTETKVELIFDIDNSEILTEEEKAILHQDLTNRISKNGILRMSAQNKRSQVWNKKIVIQKFMDTIEHTLTPQKKRIKTKTPKAINEKRLKNKRLKSEIKEMRKKLV